MSESIVAVQCPRGGHAWDLDIDTLRTPHQVVYKDPQQHSRVESSRVRGPNDGTYIAVDVDSEGE